MSLSVSVKRLSPNAVIPQRATGGSAGYDLSACLEEGAPPMIISPGQMILVPTGIAIAISSPGWGGFIFSRSGLSTKHRIYLANSVGVIDSDYRGEIKVPLVNGGQENFSLESGMRIAQLVFLPLGLPELTETESLPDSSRGEGGFGSTGLNL